MIDGIGEGPCEGCTRFPATDWNLARRLEQERTRTLADVIIHTGGNNSEAARLLGVSRSALIAMRRRLKV